MSRYYALTISSNQLVASWHTLPEGIAYLRGQLELGASTNYAHWQLMAVSSKKCRISAIKRIYPMAHVELSRSSALKDYVWKEDTAVPDTRFELGRPPTSGARGGHDWEAIWESAKTGSITDIPAHVRVTSYSVLKRIRTDHLIPQPNEKTVQVFYGAPATGKSRRAWEEATFEAFPKDPNTKFWDGYQQHTNVVIDEFRGRIDVSHLLRWLDRYPVIVEIKGASVCLAAKNFWITSNLHPREWYPDLDEDTMNALLRRLNITHFQ